MHEEQEFLAQALRHQREGRLDDAERVYRQILLDRPGQPGILNNLANVLKDSGRIEEAVELCRGALTLDPDSAEIHSSLCYKLHFHPNYDRAAVFRECRQWDKQHGTEIFSKHSNDRTPDRRLKIGYVSPDFYGHAETFFVFPLLRAHDRENFEIHCYASVHNPDRATDILKTVADAWHDVKECSDEQLAQQIRADRIDVLIDLTMHMAYNRLPMMARKPAPVQATWLAYPGGTGLSAIDYRITDARIDPSDENYAERSLRLTDCWCCYDPLGDLPPAAAREPGRVTFGSLNNPCKLNRPTLALWAKVLAEVVDSDLLLLSESEKQKAAVRQTFAAAGVDPQRVQFVPRCRRREYLRLYDRIDICLDPLVYNGITTTCDALWMGVPVLTRVGNTGPGRAGLSILSTVNLSDSIADTDEKFVETSSRLAQDFQARSELRKTLRDRMRRSPVMDAQRFARNMEAKYGEIWKMYCES
jgi:protein O-GlcNAc transferase